ncbi:phosphomevalonate kinase [Blastomyces silverae]|uniref:Phosphomevalonate kinase n=1 Tax=Blastomyces silverae TaxID=2060906 RepID=A0A0H1BBN9_9EURO|nr:phosphomevalonate kinase [Blastomyces silverae]
MPHHPVSETAVSAPGKVLLTGGYLVLDRAYTGTVFALNARIHVVVRQLRREKGKRDERVTRAARRDDEEGGGGGVEDGTGEEGKGGDGRGEDKVEDGVGKEVGEGDGDGDGDGEQDEVIVVKSPQFVDAVWEYGVRREPEGGGVRVVQKGDGPRNPFIETSLNYALTYISYVAASKLFGSLSITILADNDYYSQTATSQAAGTNRGTRFVNFGVKLHEAHKTGLGSSAALVTALVSAMVIHRTVQPEELPTVRDKLHNLAQAAHCAAQGKVGSGFDVGAAVYGSCLYRRFSPAVLGSLGDVGSPQFEERLFAVVEDLDKEHPWDTECVLQWREENREEADALWAELQQNNEKLRLLLKDLLHRTNSASRTTNAVSPSPSSASAGNNTNTSIINDIDDDNDGSNFDAVSRLISRSRELLRTMTQKSGVPIEPRVQTELLDRLSAEVEGVIGGVVPGAGGSVEDDFGGKIERVRLLGVAHGSEGLRNEIPAQYSGWMS